MTRHAFTLIEVVIATLIASLIAGLLFLSFGQIQQTSRRAERRMNFETKAIWLQHYLERDLAGACLVLQPDEQQTPSTAATDDKTKKPSTEPAKKEAPKKGKKIEKIFVYSHQGAQFESLNFITDNALPKFWGAKAAKVRPLIARVTYQLQEQKNNKGAFELVRQEGPELDPDKYNAAQNRKYTLVDGLKDFSMKFTAKFVETIEEKKPEEKPEPKPAPGGKQNQKQEEKAKPKKEGKKIKITFKDVDDWNSDVIEKSRQAAEKEKKKGPVQKLIPVYVEVSGSLWDATKKRSQPFKFMVPILGDAEFIKWPKPAASPLGLQQQPAPQSGKPAPQNRSGTVGNAPAPIPSTQAAQRHEDNEAALKRMLHDMFTCANHSVAIPLPQNQLGRMPS